MFRNSYFCEASLKIMCKYLKVSIFVKPVSQMNNILTCRYIPKINSHKELTMETFTHLECVCSLQHGIVDCFNDKQIIIIMVCIRNI